MRINADGTFRSDLQATYRPLPSFVPRPGMRWRDTGTAVKSPPRRLRCTVLVCWEEGDTDPWLLLTDGPPEASTAGGDGLRAWMAPGFQGTTRAGWPWPRPCLTTPQRAARQCLAVAVATLGLVSAGWAADETLPASTWLDMGAALAGRRRQRRATRLRVVRAWRRGWILSLVALLDQEPLPLGAFLPEPWPTIPLRDGPVRGHDSGILHDVAA